MKKTALMLSAIALTISSSIQAHEATLENVARDFADQPTKETDWYMSRLQKEIPVNTFKHNRIPSNKDHQFVIRENEDTMYSHAILDVTNLRLYRCLSMMNMPSFKLLMRITIQ